MKFEEIEIRFQNKGEAWPCQEKNRLTVKGAWISDINDKP